MKLSPDSRPHSWGAFFLWAPPAAALLHMAASVLDRPRAFAQPAELLLPQAVTLVLAVLAGLGVYLFLGLPLSRRLDPGPLELTLGGAIVLLFGLLQPIEALGGSLPAIHTPILWTLLLGLCLSLLGVAYLGGQRLAASPSGNAFLRSFLFCLPWGAAALVPVAWWANYRAEGLVGLLGLALLGALGLAAWVALARRGGPRSFASLAVLYVLVLGAPALAPWLRKAPAPGRGEVPAGLPRSVVLLTVDTLRPDFLSGREEGVATPAIDSLLADSVVFENARSAAPWTKPALATILTGLSPLVHGTTSKRVRLPEEIETLAETLRGKGYRTGGLGFNVHLEPLFNFHQGFDDYAFPARMDYGIGLGVKLLRRWKPDRYPELFPSTEAIGDAAVDWIERQEGAFFLWVHILDPHWPYAPPAHFVDEAPPRPGLGLFWGDPDTVTNVQAGRQHVGDEDREWVRELYRGEIRYADENIGRILDLLREKGLYEDSLIVFASDHGEEFWEHGNYEHGHTLFDEVLRVPLAFKLPGKGPGRTSDHPVSTESLTPTIADLVGEARPERYSSPSLRPYWEGPEPEPEALLATGTFYHGEKVMLLFDGRWKFIEEWDTKRRYLYDLETDPEELVSLADSRPDLVERAVGLIKERIQASQELRKELDVKETSASVGDDQQKLLRDLGYAGDE